jgi:hypothetical protein
MLALYVSLRVVPVTVSALRFSARFLLDSGKYS